MRVRPTVLIVDDEPFNVDYLEQELEDLGYDTSSAANGREALEAIETEPPDLVLLDIMMPILDGFAVLERLKASARTRDIPVIVISAATDLRSVARGIRLGAEDYLPKPFDPVLLEARLSSSLERKRLRDAELEYLGEVERLTAAAAAVQADNFDPASLGPVAARQDALGTLARVFERMAGEVHAREQRLRRQLEQLRQDLEERGQAAFETAAVYLPMDRRQALARGTPLAERVRGSALVADVSGSTALAEALGSELGPQRGAEELTRRLNRVFAALVDAVHHWGGSVLNLSGDAITCWFDGDAGSRAATCGLRMQAAVAALASADASPLAIKVAVAPGNARRLLVGDPDLQNLEVLAGRPLTLLAAGEQLANRGELLVHETALETAPGRLRASGWRSAGPEGARFALIEAIEPPEPPAGWPDLPDGFPSESQARPWLLPAVFERVRDGRGEFLSELRPATALFMRFWGIEFDSDDLETGDQAGPRLDAVTRWVQTVLERHGGSLLQLTVGDKGSYLYASFGVPVAHADGIARAVAAALELHAPPSRLGVHRVDIGLSHGPTRAGAYGGPGHRAYGALGDRTNLAARLMQAADGGILCDDAVRRGDDAVCRGDDAARRGDGIARYEPVESLSLKGKAEPVPAYRLIPAGAPAAAQALVDRLDPAERLTLKVASIIGPHFELTTLAGAHPHGADRDALVSQLESLARAGLVAPVAGPAGGSPAEFSFPDLQTREAAYGTMLFAQRRGLHRALAEWLERAHHGDLDRLASTLAHHWQQAEDPDRAAGYLERAAAHARAQGSFDEARAYLERSLAIAARGRDPGTR